jgi:hypothetical protein
LRRPAAEGKAEWPGDAPMAAGNCEVLHRECDPDALSSLELGDRQMMDVDR